MKRIVAIVGMAMCTTACATTGSVPGRGHVGAAIRERTGRELRGEFTTTVSLPPGVSLGALTREDAVAVRSGTAPRSKPV